MVKRKPDLHDDLDSIKSDIIALQSDLSTALKDLVAAGKGEAGAVKERLEAEVRERLDRLSDKADELAGRGKRAVHNLEHHIEEKPLQSVGIALGIGLLLGALLSRR
jgi:ElaB/YqjD/DUF883 family membrane-anchored ribosome-binding protein